MANNGIAEQDSKMRNGVIATAELFIEGPEFDDAAIAEAQGECLDNLAERGYLRPDRTATMSCNLVNPLVARMVVTIHQDE